ncbi:MAG: flagellar brake protein [Gammaproteobacteria bacterium]|nr:flagellar brake protein [Gammaproteobacteria bacterium]
MNDVTIDTGTRINIEMGTPLFVEIDGIEGKLKSKLIGLEPGSYLVIATPHGPPGARSKFTPGNRVTLRYVNQGSVYGFETGILGDVRTPVNLLLIAYPRMIVEKSLRKAERFDCYIPCHIEAAGITGDGTIVDISMAGCRCIIPPIIGKQPPRQPPAVGSDIGFSVTTPEGGKLALKANIVNTTEYHSAARVGVVFQPLDEAVRKQLEKVIFSVALGHPDLADEAPKQHDRPD